MFLAINAWTFPADTASERVLSYAAGAGFDGVELTIADDGPLRFDTPLDDCTAVARHAADLNLRIVSLASGAFWKVNYGSEEPAVRERAGDLTLRMLDRAVALNAGAILVVPAVVGSATAAAARVSYADALHRSLDTLRNLRHEAESRGVTIAIENVWNRFLLSPIEAADFVDQVNSPQVGWYFDTGNVMPFGFPEDWIATLGGRISRIHIKDYDLDRPGAEGFCPLGRGSVNWPAVLAALREVGYAGPLTYEGSGEPEAIRRHMNDLLGC